MQKKTESVIKNVRVDVEKGITLYTFKISGPELIKLGSVDRFGEDEGGVQRPLSDKHVLAIAQAMADQEVLWLEPIIGALEGSWEFDEKKGTLIPLNQIGHDACYLSIDDGQHRHAALSSGVLNSDEVALQAFEVKAYMDIDFHKRLRLFRMQGQRRSIDRNLDLAQRHELDHWQSPAHKEAYDIILYMNSNPKSPLLGRIQLNAGRQETYQAKDGTILKKIRAVGIHGQVRSCLQRRSRLSTVAPNQRRNVLVAFIKAARDTWSNHWDDPKSALCTASGLKALLGLFVAGTNFREEVGGNYTEGNVARAISFGSRFRWARRYTKNRNPKDLCDSLDEAIGRAAMKAARDSRKDQNGRDE